MGAAKIAKVRVGQYTILQGDVAEVCSGLPDGYFDGCLCDPPYGLSFMGKKWDYDVPSVETWEAVLGALKPGAHLLAFAGTRTQHRMAVRIEDAGFEIRDMIAWVYGCLSDDSEVLTMDGWERYNKASHKEILAYDPEADIYQWERPSRWSEYRVESDTAYRVESDRTDQIVSQGHRCLVERGGTLVFVSADELAGVERVPYLQGDVSTLPQGRGELLLETVLWQGEGLAQGTLSERQGEEVSEQGPQRSQESGMEGRIDVFQAEGQVRQPVDQVRSMSGGIHGHGPQRWLRHGASANRSDGVGAVAVTERVRSSHQPRRNGQPAREFDAVRVERGPQAARTQPTYQTTLATVTPIKYTGLIFCPTVSTGAFVARRNGKVFVTGNSGFPKSLDVSKAIDKAAGAEREVVGSKTITGCSPERENFGAGDRSEGKGMGFRPGDIPVTAPATEAARQWSGYGTALKPALEPITVARKPLVGTVAVNCQKYGTGALNVDGCRVGGEPWKAHRATGLGSVKFFTEGETPVIDKSPHDLGRFPANLIHDGGDEVLELAGESARFFYCAKASRSEREAGLREAGLREAGLHGVGALRDGERAGARVLNHHPTVKPIALAEYLARLILPPKRDTPRRLLVPFSGSGSEIIGALRAGWDEVWGIEISQEYVDLAEARIVHAISKMGEK